MEVAPHYTLLNIVYSGQTALHCLNSSMYAYTYIDREGKSAIEMGW